MAVTQRRREVPVPLELAVAQRQVPVPLKEPWSLACAGTCGKLLASGNRTPGHALALETRQGEMLMQTSK